MNIIQLRSEHIALHVTLGTKSTQDKKSKLKSSLAKTLEVLDSFVFSKKNELSPKNLKRIQHIETHLHFCGEKKIKTLNNAYRKKDKKTDVLSFPVNESLREEQVFIPEHFDLGDIFICDLVAIKQAKEFNITLEQEIIHLFIHGFLHLLGFDHEISKKEDEIMSDFETMLVKKSYKKIGWEK